MRGRVLGGGGQRIPFPRQAHQKRGRGVRRRELYGEVLRTVRAGHEGEEGRLPGGLQVHERPVQGGWTTMRSSWRVLFTMPEILYDHFSRFLHPHGIEVI